MTTPKQSLAQICIDRTRRCAEMRSMLDQGKSQTEIAQLFGVSKQRVGQLIGKKGSPRPNFPRIVTLMNDVAGDYLEIQMPSGEKFTIDPEDFDRVGNTGWCTRPNGPLRPNGVPRLRYVFRILVETVDGKRKVSTVQLSRLIMGLDRGDERVVDHINGNPLDNRKANLRVCTNAQNLRNRRIGGDSTSGYKGVSRKGDKWRAAIWHDGKSHLLGCFTTAKEAHAAYCIAAIKLHGEFANFG